MTYQQTPTNKQLLLLGRIKSIIASALVLALIATSSPSPARAAWHSQADNLPGFASKGAIIGVGVAAGATIGLLIYYKVHHKGATRVKLDAPPVRFDGATPGQPTERAVPVVNMMNDSITVKSLAVEDPSNAFTVSDARQVPFTIAPGEKVEIPVMLSATNAGGKARLRIVASAPGLKQDTTQFVSISYGRQTSKLRKLTHR
jgi:hypothetical protein